MIEDIDINPPKKYQNRTKSQLILNMIAVTSRYCISPSHNMACSQNRSKGTTCGLDLLHISQLIFHTRIPRFWVGLQSAHGNSHTWVPNSKNHLCCYFCLYFDQIWIIQTTIYIYTYTYMLGSPWNAYALCLDDAVEIGKGWVQAAVKGA